MIEAAARLMYDRGITATAVQDVLAASGTGKSQMYYYFGGKQGLVIAVLEHQLERVLSTQPALRDHACDDLGRWRDEVLRAHRESAFGCCPVGVFAGQVDNDPALRKLLAGLFDRWQQAIADLARRACAAHRVPADTNPDDAGLALLTALQGGIILSHLRGEEGPLVDALGRALAGVGIAAPELPHLTMAPNKLISE